MWTLLMRHHTFYVFAKLPISDNQASDATQHSPQVSQSYLKIYESGFRSCRSVKIIPARLGRTTQSRRQITASGTDSTPEMMNLHRKSD